MTEIEPMAVVLTKRETFVLQHLAAGYTLPEIQPLLTQPVLRGSHAGEPPGRNAAQKASESLRAKLGTPTMAAAVHRAHQLGMLS